MPWSLRRAASTAAVAALLAAAPARPATAQTPTGTPTASQAPDTDAADTAAPRRRPVPRSERPSLRTRPAARYLDRDTVAAPVLPTSTRSASAEAAAWTARADRSLRDEAPNWLGIPYRWGGTTRRGIDCSSFVQQYVRETLGIELPRATAGQQYEGVAISKDELRAGDLVFFRRRGVRHVGVYLSGGEFIHASSSRGVTISELADDYWTRYYWMARRIAVVPTPGRAPRPQARRDSSGARG